MRVLVADEQPVTARAVRNHFEQAGCIVTEEHDGRAAFDLAISGEYDIVISDWRMSSMPGDAFIRGVRDADERVPHLVVLTALGSDDIEAEAMASGADDFMIKPLHREDAKRIVLKRTRLLAKAS
jgi:DNA-binding response OmpR family regulator